MMIMSNQMLVLLAEQRLEEERRLSARNQLVREAREFQRNQARNTPAPARETHVAFSLIDWARRLNRRLTRAAAAT